MPKRTVSSAIILRLAAATATPYATVERCTRPLIKLDRFISNRRRLLRSSDLRCLLHAIIGDVPIDSAEIDSSFSGLTYAMSWPATIDQAPACGEGNWGAVFDRLIQGPIRPAAPLVGQIAQPDDTNDDSDIPRLPHLIEFSPNPLSVLLVWLDPQGNRRRQDFYGPPAGSVPQLYGQASMLIRKSFLDSKLIIIAGEILRDASPKKRRRPSARKVGARRA